MAKFCSQCGHELTNPNSKFCNNCGANLAADNKFNNVNNGGNLNICGHCGNEIPLNATRCVFCGTPIGGMYHQADNKKHIIIAFIISFAIPLIGIITGMFLLIRKDKQTSLRKYPFIDKYLSGFDNLDESTTNKYALLLIVGALIFAAIYYSIIITATTPTYYYYDGYYY